MTNQGLCFPSSHLSSPQRTAHPPRQCRLPCGRRCPRSLRPGRRQLGAGSAASPARAAGAVRDKDSRAGVSAALGVALGRTCAVLAPGADAAVLAIVVPRGMRPRRTAGAVELRGAEQRQRRHVTARMRSTTVRVVRRGSACARFWNAARPRKCVALECITSHFSTSRARNQPQRQRTPARIQILHLDSSQPSFSRFCIRPF